jgi:rhodanese-related sulfurtransferase
MMIRFQSLRALFAAAAVAVVSVAGTAGAQDVRITQELPYFELDDGKRFIVIERNQDQEARITDAFAKTSRPCPPFCIHPMSAGEGVETVGELELMEFLEDHVSAGTGYLVDSRLENWFRSGTIPGSVNIPFNLFENPASNPFFAPVLTSLGAKKGADGAWDFSQAKELCLFCNGPWCDQSPRAIRNLLDVGYPAEKLHYYRGGMQNWLMLGLSVEVPENAGG